MTRPKVSVLTPIYNVEQYLDKCLSSLAAQTLLDIEFICLNDGSTDGSLRILERYASDDNRFVVVDKANSGYGHTMNTGLSLAKGEYIGIVESDDFVEPNAFERLYEAAIANNCEIVKANRFSVSDDKDEYVEILKGLPYNTVFSPIEELQSIFNPGASIWSSIYKRDFLNAHGIAFTESPGASFQDTGFVYKSYIAASRMMLIQDAFLHYRVDNAGSSVRSSSKVFCVMSEFSSIDEFLERYPDKKRLFQGKYGELRFRTYKWNESRLDEESKQAFRKAFVAEFRALHEEGKLVESAFPETSWKQVIMLLQDAGSSIEAKPVSRERGVRKRLARFARHLAFRKYWK